MSKYLIIVSLFYIVLTGCGGDSNSDNNGSNTGGSVTYVEGEFKSADDTGLYAPSDPSASGDFGECHSIFNHHYFETSSVLVFGDPSLPDSDFEHAASLVEGQLQTAYSKTGFSEEEFKELRPAYSVEVQRLTIVDFLVMHYVRTDDGLDERDITDIDSDFQAPKNWDELDDNKRIPLLLHIGMQSAQTSKQGSLSNMRNCMTLILLDTIQSQKKLSCALIVV